MRSQRFHIEYSGAMIYVSALLGKSTPKPSSKIPVANRRSRVTRNESRYHSEVRHEAVQHALAQAKAQDRANRAPMPSKRKNSMAASQHANVYRNLQHGEPSNLGRRLGLRSPGS